MQMIIAEITKKNACSESQKSKIHRGKNIMRMCTHPEGKKETFLVYERVKKKNLACTKYTFPPSEVKWSTTKTF